MITKLSSIVWEEEREGYVHVCVTSIEVDQVERIKKKEEAI